MSFKSNFPFCSSTKNEGTQEFFTRIICIKLVPLRCEFPPAGLPSAACIERGNTSWRLKEAIQVLAALPDQIRSSALSSPVFLAWWRSRRFGVYWFLAWWRSRRFAVYWTSRLLSRYRDQRPSHQTVTADRDLQGSASAAWPLGRAAAARRARPGPLSGRT